MPGNDVESNAVWFAKMATRPGDMENPDAKVIRYKVFDRTKEDITDQVREQHFGKHDESYDKYLDHEYVRSRLSIKRGSVADENFDPDVAGVYLRRIDKYNKLGK